MNIVDLLEFILIFVIGICFYLSKAKDMLKKKNEIKNIDFRPLTQEEEKKYRKFSNIVIIDDNYPCYQSAPLLLLLYI